MFNFTDVYDVQCDLFILSLDLKLLDETEYCAIHWQINNTDNLPEFLSLSTFVTFQDSSNCYPILVIKDLEISTPCMTSKNKLIKDPKVTYLFLNHKNVYLTQEWLVRNCSLFSIQSTVLFHSHWIIDKCSCWRSTSVLKDQETNFDCESRFRSVEHWSILLQRHVFTKKRFQWTLYKSSLWQHWSIWLPWWTW